jgi:hypothetical protein
MPMALSRSEELFVHRDSEPGLLYYSVKTISLQPGTARILPSLIFSLLIFGLAAFMQANMLLHADCNVFFVSAAFYSILPPKRHAIYFELFSLLY